MDRIRVYDTEKFFSEYDNAAQVIEFFEDQTGYNWDRPCCFMAEGILAVAHNPDEGEKENSRNSSVIELYDTVNVIDEPYRYVTDAGETEAEGVWHYHKKIKTIPFDGLDLSWEEDQDPSFTPICNEVSGSLYYDSRTQVFIGMGKQKGLYIAGSEGNLLLEDAQYKDWRYSPAFRVFYRFKTEGGYTVTVRSLEEVLEGA
jgi:hypothetical protein